MTKQEIINSIDLIKIAKKEQSVYPELVDCLIRERYSVSQVEAIMNNYLDEPNEKHTAEFQSLQAYRRECKAQAKEILGIE